ncbi:MAG: hypothetical protein AAFV25_15140 [Bacteroidota bacterium]
MARKKTSSRRKKSTAKPLPQTKKFNGKNYKKDSCSTTKTNAKKTAKGLREKGKLARVVKDPKTKKHCVYTRSK